MAIPDVHSQADGLRIGQEIRGAAPRQKPPRRPTGSNEYPDGMTQADAIPAEPPGDVPTKECPACGHPHKGTYSFFRFCLACKTPLRGPSVDDIIESQPGDVHGFAEVCATSKALEARVAELEAWRETITPPPGYKLSMVPEHCCDPGFYRNPAIPTGADAEGEGVA